MLQRSLLSRLRQLPRSERAELVSAQWELLATWARVSLRPKGQLVSAVRDAPQVAVAEPDASLHRRARSLALAVNRAATHGVFRPQCLVRAVALKALLDRRGIHGSRVHIGVRNRGGEFSAHAWVEYAGEVLGDRVEHIGSFSRLPDVSVLEPQ